jgi:hypothetical protein
MNIYIWDIYEYVYPMRCAVQAAGGVPGVLGHEGGAQDYLGALKALWETCLKWHAAGTLTVVRAPKRIASHAYLTT